MARAAGISATELTPMLVSWLTDTYPALSTFAKEIDDADYTTEESNLAMNQAGLATIINASLTHSVPAATLLPLKELVDRQVAAGHGAASLARAVESLR
jgi:NADPH-dependent reductive aminase-like protein